MKDIAIYGAGGFGREIFCLIQMINKINPQWNVIGFFDDGKAKDEQVKYGKILGGISDLNNWSTNLNVIIAIGNPKTLQNIVSKISNPLIQFPNIISPTTSFSDIDSFKIGKGNIVQGNSIFSCDVNIGNFNVFNGGTVMGHDVNIGDFNVFMPACRISGEVNIGKGNLFGVMSCVIQQIKVSNGITLGAGSVLMTKPKEGNLYIGVPAKIFKY